MDLKAYLQQSGLTATAFAEQIGVEKITVSRYLRRERKPRAEILQKIIEATDGKVRSSDFYEAA